MSRPPLKKSAIRCRKDETHERIVHVAARAIRRTGYSGIGVADLMRDAGLTHGGFYAHFASRDAMLAEAADRAGADSVARLAAIGAGVAVEQAREAMLHAYLSAAHAEEVETACVNVSLCSETARQSALVRRVATCRIKELIDLFARQPSEFKPYEAHRQSLITVSLMVGALALARAVDEPELAAQLREAALEHLGCSQKK
jgi:TetR/AcrR family transcriptional repressor of nem operon